MKIWINFEILIFWKYPMISNIYSKEKSVYEYLGKLKNTKNAMDIIYVKFTGRKKY